MRVQLRASSAACEFSCARGSSAAGELSSAQSGVSNVNFNLNQKFLNEIDAPFWLEVACQCSDHRFGFESKVFNLSLGRAIHAGVFGFLWYQSMGIPGL